MASSSSSSSSSLSPSLSPSQLKGKCQTPTDPTILSQKLQAEKSFSKSLLEENNRLKIAIKRLQKQVLERDKIIQENPTNFNANSAKTKKDNVQLDMETVMAFLITHGGLSRFTILDHNWHNRNPHACLQLFGFKTWKDCREKIAKKFPEIFLEAPQIYRSKKNLIDMGEATDFEKCLCVKFMNRTGMTAGRTALLFGRDKRTIVKWKEKWCPKWGIDRHLQQPQPQPQQGMDKDGTTSSDKMKNNKRPKSTISTNTNITTTTATVVAAATAAAAVNNLSSEPAEIGGHPADIVNLLGQPPLQLQPMMNMPTLHQIVPGRHHHHSDDRFPPPSSSSSSSRRNFSGI